MSRDVQYEIARYAVDSDEEVLLERFHLVAERGSLFRLGIEGTEMACEHADAVAVIEADSALNEVRANQVTRIEGDQSIIDELPLLLAVPGDVTEASDWSTAMADEHLVPLSVIT